MHLGIALISSVTRASLPCTLSEVERLVIEPGLEALVEGTRLNTGTELSGTECSTAFKVGNLI